MSYLVDTNVLLRSVLTTHQMHAEASRAIKTLMVQGEELCVISQNLIEFWAVATRPLIANGLGLTIERAAQEMKNLKGLFKFCPDSEAIFSEWEKLVIQHQVMGKPTHDARIVAAVNVHGIKNLLAFNADDFKRFSGITVVNPQTVT